MNNYRAWKVTNDMTVMIIGSFMMDQVVSVPQVPKNGETIIGNRYDVFPGGKGANQAVAAARLGAKVIMVGKVGKDEYGGIFLNVLKKENININNILIDDTESTGMGFVTKEDNGNNRIVVILGANLAYSSTDFQMIKSLKQKIDIVVFQLEMDFELTKEAINYYYNKGIPILLNPAPARKLTKELLSKVTYLTPNETELELLTGIKIDSIENAVKAAKILLNAGVENIIVTLGDKGALIVNDSIEKIIVGYNVKAVDTVAAGDSFNGAFAVAISKGKHIVEAVKYANIIGALTVTKNGAIPSLPTTDDVIKFINKQNIL